MCDMVSIYIFSYLALSASICLDTPLLLELIVPRYSSLTMFW